MYDILIKNGTVIDGTGKEKYKADIAIKQDHIYEIGEFRTEEARVEIDASGKFVSPGFIDVNNHSDVHGRLLLNPKLSGLLQQGITTILGGNCGVSLAPVLSRQSVFELLSRWSGGMSATNIDWVSVREFFEALERKPMGVNFGTLVGYGTIRQNILRGSRRALTSDEMKSAEKLLRESLIEGVFGVSVGMAFSSDLSVSPVEMERIFRVLIEFDGVCAVHMRNESSELVESVQELMNNAAGLPVKIHISHMKASGEPFWNMQEEALRILHSAAHAGFDATYDVCPYTMTGSLLYILLPQWTLDEGVPILLKKIKHISTRREIVAEMKKQRYDYNKIYVSKGGFGKASEKKSIGDIARDQHADAEEVVLEHILASEGKAMAIMDILSDHNVEQLVSGEMSIIATDGFESNEKNVARWQLPHPRNFGSFPHALSEYVRKRDIFSWEEAIYKMTGFPARRFGIVKRGVLQEGNYADIVIFDPKKIEGASSIEHPVREPFGIEYVLVNGEISVQSGKVSGVLAGKVLRK